MVGGSKYKNHGTNFYDPRNDHVICATLWYHDHCLFNTISSFQPYYLYYTLLTCGKCARQAAKLMYLSMDIKIHMQLPVVN